MIRDPHLDFLPIQDPGAKKEPEAGPKRNRSPDPEHGVLAFGLVTFSLDGGLAAGLTFLSPDSMLSNRSEGDVSFFAGGFLALAAIFLAKPPDGTQRTVVRKQPREFGQNLLEIPAASQKINTLI
jgi:hypothetical protein